MKLNVPLGLRIMWLPLHLISHTAWGKYLLYITLVEYLRRWILVSQQKHEWKIVYVIEPNETGSCYQKDLWLKTLCTFKIGCYEDCFQDDIRKIDKIKIEKCENFNLLYVNWGFFILLIRTGNYNKDET